LMMRTLDGGIILSILALAILAAMPNAAIASSSAQAIDKKDQAMCVIALGGAVAAAWGAPFTLGTSLAWFLLAMGSALVECTGNGW